jgi:CheY-like chemotaxis protein
MRVLRILVVDDTIDSADMLSVMLQMYGHDPTVVHDGAQALDLAATMKPDAIFLDIGLPDIDGNEVARRMRASPHLRNTHIVATTGFSDANDRRRAKEAGFDSFLVKPIDPAEVEKIVNNLAE